MNAERWKKLKAGAGIPDTRTPNVIVHSASELLTLRSAILELAQAYQTLERRQQLEAYQKQGRDRFLYLELRKESTRLTTAITKELRLSADRGEIDHDQIASRIFDVIRETEERLGVKLTQEGDNNR